MIHIATLILAQVEPGRLAKAAEGLAAHAYAIRFTRQHATEIRAFIAHGDGREYGCTLTAHGAFCSCADSMFRHTLCKHAALLALAAIRAPKAPEPPAADAAPEPQSYNLTLAKTRKGFAFPA
jgi:hypothetical protein